ncbi:MAG: hypothetical protein NTX82_03090 [Candidatus Parcubacteria bacterium]|nr:hypothetical protein [Candidatus Parcubacteria bacterium]
MKNFLFFLSLIVFSLISVSAPINAAADLTNVTLGVNPLNASSLATWTISFTVPEDTKLGHILISFGGYQPDLDSAELFVSGIPQGTPVVGKSNPSCVFNCDDIRYYYKEPISVKKGTKVTFTLNKVKNSDKVGQTGLNFINVFSSKYPQMTLAYSSGEKLVNLSEALSSPEDEELIPATTTAENIEPVTGIANVKLNELFFQPGAKTTKLDALKDSSKVENLTLDLLGKERVTFNGILDLSKPEAVKFLENLGDFMTFDKLKLEVKQDLMDQFKVPLDITYYDLPYVWDPDILKNGTDTLTKDKMENYHYVIFDNKPQVSFTVKEGGVYQLVPHLEIFITDNQKIQGSKDTATFSGRISDPKAQIAIALNGKELDELNILADPVKGEFSFSLKLLPGTNLIEVKVISELGTLPKITKLVQYLAPEISQPKEQAGISPFNLIALGLAVLAIVFIFAIWRLAKKRK